MRRWIRGWSTERGAKPHRRIDGRKFVLCALFVCAPVRLLPAQSLTKRLDALLDAPPLNRHLWGIAIADTTGRTLFARNADRLFIPASNTKLLVTAAAAVLLAPDWTARTSLYATGPVTGGVLQGHLVLYGRGDPTMGRPVVSEIAMPHK